MLEAGTWVIIAQLAVLSAVLIVLSYYITRSMVLNRKIAEASEIVQGIIYEIRGRLNSQDRKMADHTVRIDLIEVKIDRMARLGEDRGSLREVPFVTQQVKSQMVVGKKVGKLSDAEREIIKVLEDGPLRVSDVRSRIGRSREHTARVMKKLFEQGHLYRDERKKPYLYRKIEATSVVA